jgi:hypothetical protein
MGTCLGTYLLREIETSTDEPTGIILSFKSEGRRIEFAATHEARAGCHFETGYQDENGKPQNLDSFDFCHTHGRVV